MEPSRKIKFYVTDVCNERCTYCPIHGEKRQRAANVLPASSVVAIARQAVSIGYHAVKFSGEYGETLLRQDLEEIVRGTKEIGAQEIGVATNGLGLLERLGQLLAAGMNKLCVSLDSMQADIYRRITGSDRVDEVIQAIRRASDILGRQVKVNMVVLKGVNTAEIGHMRQWVKSIGATLQLIEMFQVAGRRAEFHKHYYPLGDLAKSLRRKAVYSAKYKPRKAELFVLKDGENVQVTATKSMPESWFGPDRLLVHPDGRLANYDVRTTGLAVSGTEPEEVIRDRLREAASIGLGHIGLPGVTPWGSESPAVS